MRTFLRRFGRLLKIGTLGSTVGFVGCVLLQIFARLFLSTAPSWTEEGARLFFVLAVGFAAGLALRSGEYVRFDFFYGRMSPVWQRRLDGAIALATVLFFLLFTVAALRFTAMGWVERSPGLRFPMAIAFAGTAVLGLSVLVYALDRLRQHFLSKSSGR